jgi:signal transduction histidine kinase
MAQHRVLVVADEDAAAEFGRGFDESDVTVRATTDVREVFDALCYETVDALVVPDGIGDVSACELLRGVRAVYPTVPTVVVGDGAQERARSIEATDGGAGDGTTRVVESASLSDGRVGEAVADTLSEDGGAAARPPSRLETLAMSMFDGFPDHLYAKDRGARHVLTSDRTVDTADVVGLTDEAIDDLSAENAPKTISDDEYVIGKGEPLLEREEYTDGYEEYALTSKVPWVGPDGEVLGLVGITRDITDRKDRERQLRQRNERLAKIAIVAAHELRNELQVASGRLDLVTEDPSHLPVVDRALENLDRIVDDVVTLADAESGATETETTWLSTPAREVWESLPTEAAALEVLEDRLVTADPRSMRLLFEILLSNALEHAGEDVTVTLGATDDGFYVADDGDGIELDPPERVFDVGFELEGEDVGIGLFVARRIANDHGWSLDATNREGGGARFEVTGVSDPRED